MDGSHPGIVEEIENRDSRLLVEGIAKAKQNKAVLFSMPPTMRR